MPRPSHRTIAEVMLERLRDLYDLEQPDIGIALGFANLAMAEALEQVVEELRTVNFHLSREPGGTSLPANQEQRRLLIAEVMETPKASQEKLTGFQLKVIDALARLGGSATVRGLAQELVWEENVTRQILKLLRIRRIVDSAQETGRRFVWHLVRPELASIPVLPPPERKSIPLNGPIQRRVLEALHQAKSATRNELIDALPDLGWKQVQHALTILGEKGLVNKSMGKYDDYQQGYRYSIKYDALRRASGTTDGLEGL